MALGCSVSLSPDRNEYYSVSLTPSVLIKAAAAQIGKPHPAEDFYIELPV
jgi:hypothetical protein